MQLLLRLVDFTSWFHDNHGKGYVGVSQYGPPLDSIDFDRESKRQPRICWSL